MSTLHKDHRDVLIAPVVSEKSYGLLDANKVGTVDDVIEKRAYFAYYMHRTGHWLGMDVHDCGSYVEPSEVGDGSERKDALSGETITNRPSRILQPGMVLTIEPGIYVRPGPGVPEQFHNIGIRIEDDALVTEIGNEILTAEVPKQADDIEALMRDASSSGGGSRSGAARAEPARENASAAVGDAR